MQEGDCDGTPPPAGRPLRAAPRARDDGDMRAVMYERYGSPERLELRDIPRPVPGAGEVLVEVFATSVNLSDWEGLHGSPAYARLGGLFRPHRGILGSDIAGRVAAVGDGATRFAVGDAVFGDIMPRYGGFAEFVAVPESMLAPKPVQLSFAEAAAVPQAAAIATHAVALAEPGARMLLNGAGGGSGSLAIQLAVQRGVHVTAVDNAGKLDFLRALGADEVIDYRRDDFTRQGPYDLIVDLVARRSVFAYAPRAREGRPVRHGGRNGKDTGTDADRRRACRGPHPQAPGCALRAPGAFGVRAGRRTLRGRRGAGAHRSRLPARPGPRGSRVAR